jgi:hypothetical protein
MLKIIEKYTILNLSNDDTNLHEYKTKNIHFRETQIRIQEGSNIIMTSIIKVIKTTADSMIDTSMKNN